MKSNQYNLYISKSSDLRDRIHDVVDKILVPQIKSDSYDEDRIDRVVETIASSQIYMEKSRQTTYAVVDLLLLTYLETSHFDQLVDYLLSKFRQYIVIHELAALSWGDGLVVPDKIFALLGKSDLSIKHKYHILNEMSVSYPRRTLNYIDTGIRQGHFEPKMHDKIMKKMIQDRKRTRPLAKNAYPVLTVAEIRDLDTSNRSNSSGE